MQLRGGNGAELEHTQPRVMRGEMRVSHLRVHMYPARR